MDDDASFRILVDGPLGLVERGSAPIPEASGGMLSAWLAAVQDHRKDEGRLLVTAAADIPLAGELRSDRLDVRAWHTWRSKQSARQLLEDIEFMDARGWSPAPDKRAVWI